MTPQHSNHDHQAPDDEVLCALFDGELQGDAARFATKRLGHDAQWRQACGRWQLYGDVLRGQAQGVAAGGFADRVALAIAREPQLQQAVAEPVRAAVGMRRGWIGGALAASVAVAALFVTRPFSDEPASPAADAPARVATATTPAAPVVSTNPSAPRAPAAPTQRSPDRSLELAAAAAVAA
ncbi:MAG TPA: sigma-E factor negative regulatory protein, partial [Lysobacter sp.]